MNEKIFPTLTGVPETLLMTLLVRARESQRPNPLIKDDQAVAMVNQLDCDFSRLRMQRHDEVAVIMRMRKFDDHVRNFLARHSDAVIVHIGCGLDTRFERVDNQRVEWFDLDIPDVIELRHKLLDEQKARHHFIASSVFEDAWLEDVERFKPRPVKRGFEWLDPRAGKLARGVLSDHLRITSRASRAYRIVPIGTSIVFFDH